MTEHLTADSIDPARWSELVEASSQATVFQSWEWCEVLSRTFEHYRAHFFVEIDDRGNYLAGLPIFEVKKYGLRNYYSMPFGCYGGIVSRENASSNGHSRIINQTVSFVRNTRTGLARLTDYYETLERFLSHNFFMEQAFTYVLQLEGDLDSIWETKVHSKTRNMVRQAKQRGVAVREIDGKQELRACYRMYSETAKRHGSTRRRYGFGFYENLYDVMVAHGKAKWLVAEKESLLVGNALFLLFKDDIFYWDDASLQQYWNLRPNNALVWSAIKFGVENGYSRFNLGATPNGATGLIRFKERWGAQKVEYPIFQKQSFLYSLYPFRWKRKTR